MLSPNAIPKGSITQEMIDAPVLDAKQDVIDDLDTIREGAKIGNEAFDIITSMVNAGYLFAGIATPTTDPGTPDAKVFYIANGKGTYTNFGGLEVAEDDVVVLYYDIAWHKVASGIASNDKLTELVAKADIVDITGSATDKVMSQHGVTEAINGVTNKVTELTADVGALNEVINGNIDAELPWESGLLGGLPPTTPYDNAKYIKLTNLGLYTTIKAVGKVVYHTGYGAYYPLIAAYADGGVDTIKRYTRLSSTTDTANNPTSSISSWYSVTDDGYEVDVAALLLAEPSVTSLYLGKYDDDYITWYGVSSKGLGVEKRLENAEISIDEVKNDIISLQSETKSFANNYPLPDIVMPNKIIAVVGHEYNIYYRNIIRCTNIDDYEVQCSLSPSVANAKNYGNCLRFTPTAAGNHTLTLRVRRKKETSTITQKAINLIIINDNAVTDKKVLFIGDSLTDAGYYPAELQHNLSHGGIVSIGTRQDSVIIGEQTLIVNHEGRAGWATTDYTRTKSDYKTSPENPFWDGSKVNFSYYMQQQGYSGVDVVCLNLGTNDAGSEDDAIEALDIMIASIHDYDPNIQVLVSLITSSATQTGWGYYAGLSTREQFESRAFDLKTSYLANYENKNKVDVSELCVCIDSDNDFDEIQVPASSRNPKLITIQTNNVHPNIYGYLKMADVLYNNILYYLTK